MPLLAPLLCRGTINLNAVPIWHACQMACDTLRLANPKTEIFRSNIALKPWVYLADLVFTRFLVGYDHSVATNDSTLKKCIDL